MQFFPAWCYALPKTILDLPLSLWEALLWTAVPYFAVGFYKDAGRSDLISSKQMMTKTGRYSHCSVLLTACAQRAPAQLSCLARYFSFGLFPRVAPGKEPKKIPFLNSGFAFVGSGPIGLCSS